MSSRAILGKSSSSCRVVTERPVVFVDGVIRPDLWVISYASETAFDFCHATLGGSSDLSVEIGRMAIIALPCRLIDGVMKWRVLIHGRIARIRLKRRSKCHEDELSVVDTWQDRFAGLRTLEDISGWLSSVGVSALCGYESFKGDISDLPGFSTGSGNDIELHLRSFLDRAGIFLRRVIEWDGHTVTERQVVLESSWMPQVSISGTDVLYTSDSDVISRDEELSGRGARRYVVQGAHPVIESTFTLVPGWDPGLEDESEDCYSRSSSDDFDRYRNVFRYWSLNEDGRFSRPPYDRPLVFDAGVFFGQRLGASIPLRFLPCISRDPDGRCLEPVVEWSQDGGNSWWIYPGGYQVDTDTASVYFDDDVLPSGVITSWRGGELMVRVTASLRSSERMVMSRWQGNPFNGIEPECVYVMGDVFKFREVCRDSLFYGDVSDGLRSADEVDDSTAMSIWLVRESMIRCGDRGYSEVKLVLAGDWTVLHPGWRLLAGGNSNALVVDRVECDYGVEVRTTVYGRI